MSIVKKKKTAASPSTQTGNAEKILNTAEKLMSKKGIIETSLADIAKAAGISRGTLFYYYKSKDDLICDVAEKHMQAMTAQLIKTAETDTGRDIQKIFAVLIETIARDHQRGNMHHYLLHEVFSGNKKIRTRLRSSYTQWKKMVSTEIIARGLNLPSATAAELIVAALDGLIIQSMLGITESSAEDYGLIISKYSA